MSIVGRALRPFQQFAATESAGGIVLLACTATAFGWANSPWAASYHHLWERTLTVGLDSWALSKTLHHWINDGLMVVFFFLVGLEIKRELRAGELASARQAALPIAAALGGMLIPAAIYVLVNWGGAGSRGWAIPMATDIAFALGVLSLLGTRIPTALKVFLAALAIVDDIGAVLVIAVFYSGDLSMPSLMAAAAVTAALIVCNWIGVRRPAVYAGLGILLWLAVLSSGIHATIAGVVLAMTVPATTLINEDEFIARADEAVGSFERASGAQRVVISNPAQQEALHQLTRAVTDVQAPLMRMEHALHALVAFGIMPLFALANAGVSLGGGVLASLSWPVVIGVVLGLVVGKSVGITAAAWIATRTGIAAPMPNIGWRAVYGVGWLGGIGFTMSLFIAGLAFNPGPLLDSAKVGILAGSVIAGLGGWMLLKGLPSVADLAEGAGDPEETVKIYRFPTDPQWPPPSLVRSDQ